MNGKSQTKKILAASKTKFQIETIFKKHKSQESYTDLNTLSTQIAIKTSKSKQNLSPRNNQKITLNINTNKISNLSIKNLMNLNNINSYNNPNKSTNIGGVNLKSNNSPVANINSYNKIFNSDNGNNNINNMTNSSSGKFAHSSSANKYGSSSKSDKKQTNSSNKNILLSNLNNITNKKNENQDENKIIHGGPNKTNEKITLNNLSKNNLNNILMNVNYKIREERNLDIKNQENNYRNKAINFNNNSETGSDKNGLIINENIFSRDCAKIIDTEENEEEILYDTETPEKFEGFSLINIPKENIEETFNGLISTTNYKKNNNMIKMFFNQNNSQNANKFENQNINFGNENPNTKRTNYISSSDLKNRHRNRNNDDANMENSIEEYDEIRSNCMLKDFYTNSIGEASCSLVDKGEGIINNIPNTFVRQSENKLIIHNNSKPFIDLNTNNSTSHIDKSNQINCFNKLKPKSNSIKSNLGTNLGLNNAYNNCFAKISSDEVTNINDNSDILEKSYLNNPNFYNNNKSNGNQILNKSANENLIADLNKLKGENNVDKYCKSSEKNKYQNEIEKPTLKKNSEKKVNAANTANNKLNLTNDIINNKQKIKNFINNLNHNNFTKFSYNNNYLSNLGNKRELITSNSNNIFNTNFDFKKYILNSKPKTNSKNYFNYYSNNNSNLNLNNNSMHPLDNFRQEIFYTDEHNISPTNREMNINSKQNLNNCAASNQNNKLIIKNIQENRIVNKNVNTNFNLDNNNINNDESSRYVVKNNKQNFTQGLKEYNSIILDKKLNNINKNQNKDVNTSKFFEDINIPRERDPAYSTQYSNREASNLAYHINNAPVDPNSLSKNINNLSSINCLNENNLSKSANTANTCNSSSNIISSSSSTASNYKIESTTSKLYSNLLVTSKKGDRDAFLETLTKIYKIEGDKTNIAFKDENGWTALHYATDEGNFKIVEILMKMNIDSNLRTASKKTALHLSAENGYFDVSKILIENGALLSLLDDEKNSPIHICAERGHFELLKYFLEKFPQADTKNIYGKTPLDLAANDIIRDLLIDFVNRKSYNFHKITIHNTNSKIVKEFLNNVKEIKKQTDDLENLNQVNNFSTTNNNHNLINKNNQSNNLKSPNINLNSKMIQEQNFIKSNNNNLYNENENTKYIKIDKHTNNKNNDNCLSNQNKAFFDKKSSSSGSSFKASSANPANSSIENLKFKEKKSSEINNYSDEYSANSNLEYANSYEEEKNGPSSFICHALLGKGSFGEVYLVEKRDTKIFYAMKVLSKDKIMAQNLVKYAMTERNVLSVTNHPFIVKLNYSFQTNDKLFLILDYCPGGDLAEHLSNEKRFSEERAKIYLCEIILALEDLHKRDIIFRDLKPDNVVLDYEGHAMLTDFGLSKEGVYDNKGAKSFCGSIAYLAPEMLKRSGHGKSVDWYLLGVLFYEMLVGLPPFFNCNKEQLFKNIETQELQYPKILTEGALLNKDPCTRLGASKKDAEEIKRHPYFKEVNWDDVYNRKLQPPIPTLKNKYIEILRTPKIFEESENSESQIFENSNKYFDNWSFVKNNNIYKN